MEAREAAPLPPLFAIHAGQGVFDSIRLVRDHFTHYWNSWRQERAARRLDSRQIDRERLHERLLDEQTGGQGLEGAPRRLAVVAIYPSEESLTFTLTLLRLLDEAGFRSVVVATAPLTPVQQAAVLPLCAHLAQRMNVGHDIGSYQWGLRWLQQRGLTDTAEHLLMVNDSMFWPRALGAELAAMLDNPEPWQCLFESFDHDHHAQSFFLLFRQEVFRGAAFRAFWEDYRPYSRRSHAIAAGELGLSRALRAAGLMPAAAYDTARLQRELTASTLTAGEVAALAPFSRGWPLKRQAALEVAQAGLSPAEQRALLAVIACQAAEACNPTHSVGLLWNRLVAAPLKRDLCVRGSHSLGQLLGQVRGLAPEEIRQMERDLRRRGLPAAVLGTRRLMWTWFGRC